MPPENENLDAKETVVDSSTTTDANPTAASSTATNTDANKDKAPQKDFAELAVEALLKPSESSTEKTTDPSQATEKGDINKSNKTDEQPPQAASDQQPPADDKTKKSDKVEDFSDLPFHKHERFQTLLKERNDLKTQAETSKIAVERQSVLDQFMAANHITLDQFKTALEIQALINTSPETAYERIQPLVKHLETFKGLVLPDDLKTEVDAGTLPLARAQEIAKLRKQSQFKEQQAQVTANETQAERLMTALRSWEDTTRRTDADYERKQNFVMDRFVKLSANNPWQSPTDILALAKRAYDEINNELGVFIPKPKPTKSPPANGHSSAAKREFTSWDQAEDLALQVASSHRR